MIRHLPIMLSIFLCHCGTEVGNGITRPEKADSGTAKSDATTTETAGSAQAPNAGDTASPTTALALPFSTYFLAACASPFGDKISGTFMNVDKTTGFKVTVAADGKESLTQLTGALLFTIVPTTATDDFGIEALPVSPAVTCSALKSETLVDGTVQRSATLNSTIVISWIVTTNSVTSLKLTPAQGAVENWIKTSD